VVSQDEDKWFYRTKNNWFYRTKDKWFYKTKDKWFYTKKTNAKLNCLGAGGIIVMNLTPPNWNML
jgi:hypothetical protein